MPTEGYSIDAPEDALDAETVSKIVDWIVEQKNIMMLATASLPDGAPWACPLEYFMDDKRRIFWKSNRNARHSQHVAQNQACAAVIEYADHRRHGGAALQIEGRVTVLDSADNPALYAAMVGRRPYAPKDAEAATKVSDQQWYMLTPTLMYLHYEPKLGYLRMRCPLPDTA